MSSLNYNRFLNNQVDLISTDYVLITPPNFYATATEADVLSKATSSNTADTLVKRGATGEITTGDLNIPQLFVNGVSETWRRTNIGQRSSSVNTSFTYTLPTGNWAGEITLVYGNSSGRTANRRYCFYKRAGGTGFLTQLYHNFTGSTDSSITFDSSTGVFTITLNQSFGGVNSFTFIDMMSAP